MEQLLEEKVYKKLRYREMDWYKNYGVNFFYTDSVYRLIGKVFFILILEILPIFKFSRWYEIGKFLY